MLLKDRFERYLTSEKNYSVHTVSAYLHDLDGLAAFLESQIGLLLFDASGAQKTDHRILRAWMGHLLDEGLAKRSVSRKLASASTYFRFLRKTGVVGNNPVSRLTAPRFEKKLPSFLREEDALQLFAEKEFPDTWEGKRDKAILELLYGCGLRRSELIGLEARNIDYGNMTVKVMGKGRKERIVPFGAHVKSAFQSYRKACQEQGIDCSQHFFVREDGKAMDPRKVYAMVNSHIGRVSTLRKKSPHVLRHTFATHLLNAGADLNAIKELLGHKSLAATQVYVHNSIAKLKSVYAKAHPKA